MPPRLPLALFLFPRGGLLLRPTLRRPFPALSPALRNSPSNKRPGAFSSFFSPARAASGYSGMAAGSPEQQRSVVVKETVELTEKEDLIFRRLLDVVRHFGLGSPVAGCGTSNPDQSKHLETARMLILDIWIDFVNLRSETYAENSRIPTMEIGTAKEDAYRRDLTINSLFYNINNKSVEDLTGRGDFGSNYSLLWCKFINWCDHSTMFLVLCHCEGIEDLKKGLIVTPLPAKATFLDDPLRVLRAIRFAARFNFTLAEDLKEVASDEKVRLELGTKISRECIGHEIDLMMSDKHPVKSKRELPILALPFLA